jgi:hypothetical protein
LPPHLLRGGEPLVHVDALDEDDRQLRHVGGRGARLGEDGDQVAERLLRLRAERVADDLAIGADTVLAADNDDRRARGDDRPL